MDPVDPRSVRRVTRSDDNIRPLGYSFQLLTSSVFFWGVSFLRGAGEVASGVFNEVSLALVGVTLPGLIPIIVYFPQERNSFLYGP
jgi:hypothetical protein